MSFDSVMAVLLLSMAAVVILKSFGFRGAPLVAILVTLVAISLYEGAISEIYGVFSYLGELSESEEYVNAALKVVGISYLSGISADVCREMGEGGIAKTVSLVTKLELLALCVPYIKEILAALLSLMQQ